MFETWNLFWLSLPLDRSRCFSLFAGVEKHIDEFVALLPLLAAMEPAFVCGPPINAVIGKGGFLFIITVSKC